MKRTRKSSPKPAPLVAFGAHPDDIEFGCGGVIAQETRTGRPTDGHGSISKPPSENMLLNGADVTDLPPIIIDEDAAIDSAFFGSHAGRSCYARAHRSGWVLVVRQAVAQREPPVMLRVWGRVERVPDDDASCLALWERCANPR